MTARRRIEHVKERIYALDAQAVSATSRQFRPVKPSTSGVNYTDRRKTKRSIEWDLMLKNGRTQTLVDSQYLIDPTSLGYAGD